MLEPSAGSDARSDTVDAVGSAESAHSVSLEVARLEDLLSARARERRELHGELQRTTALLRDALARFASLPTLGAASAVGEPPAVAPVDDDVLASLRAERDAAASQALEAEARAAETAFRLDEALGHLLCAQRAPAQDASIEGKARGFRARAAEAEEALAVAEARLVLSEDDLRVANERSRRFASELQQAGEQCELELLRMRSYAASESQRMLALHAAGDAVIAGLRGERDGVRARSDECELALTAAQAWLVRTERSLADTAGELAEAHAQYAELQIVSQAQAAQLAAVETRRVDRAVALRGMWSELRSPLQELAAAVQSVVTQPGAAAGSSVPGHSELTEEPTMPGVALPIEALDAIERKLEASEHRVQELEAMVAGRMAARDPQLSTLKGELIDVRANATRLADDLAKERTRRRKLGVTVRALQAASESGEDAAPWLEEIIALINESATVPPPR